jgi:hypothetical protein
MNQCKLTLLHIHRQIELNVEKNNRTLYLEQNVLTLYYINQLNKFV